MTTTVAGADARALDEQALRGMLAQFERRRDGSRLLVITAAPAWDGPELVETDAATVRVVEGRSVLAVRAAMAELPDEPLVVLTALPMSELGDEVKARAWRQRAHRPSPWDAVKALFRVDDLDPSLRGERWMVDLLVQLAPARGYAQPMSQVLDRATAWRTLYRYGLQLTTDEPTTADLLDWAMTSVGTTALERLSDDDREHIGEHLALIAGPAAAPLLRLVGEGRGADALALGLVVDALWPGCDPEARILLQERYLTQRALPDAAADDWGRAAVATVRRQQRSGEPPTALLARAGEVLAEVDRHGSGDSAVLDPTFPRRLAALGRALTAVLDGGPGRLPAADAALAAVSEHLRAAREPARVERAHAALRLCRRAVDPARPGVASSLRLADLAGRYVEEGAWVDAARHRLAEGESVSELVDVYKRILGTLDEERAVRDRTFAAAVAAEAALPSTGAADLTSTRLLPIEHVLGTVVAPVARLQPVLLLVIDGLSHPAAVDLVADLRREGWQPHGPSGVPLPPVVAALPTVTVVSRASLLTGRLQRGGRDVEREGFASHPGLLDAASGQEPVLFHKSDLRPADGQIAPEVREVVADPDRRVVGVVVNGVDDFLGGGDQLRLADGLEGIPVLKPVLGAAAEARRVVVMASDHGHILGSRQRVVAAPGGGERFRPAGRSPQPTRSRCRVAGCSTLSRGSC